MGKEDLSIYITFGPCKGLQLACIFTAVLQHCVQRRGEAMKTNGGWKLILILLSTVIPADKWKQQQEEK
jgi:hypothetical protein